MRLFRVNVHEESPLDVFVVVSTPAGAHEAPTSVDFTGALPVQAPCTVARALAAVGALDLARPPDLDREDHWFRATIPASDERGERAICFDGLATLAEVWLDGVLIGRSDSMFVPLVLPLPAERGAGELILCFRALLPVLGQRRPRPRWRTRIVEQQQLRYVRTSLFGRTPGFCPSVPVVGPYRPVRLLRPRSAALDHCTLRTSLSEGRGAVAVSLTLRALAGFRPEVATLVVAGPAGSGRAALSLERSGDQLTISGSLIVDQLAAWWPHTHGDQPLSRAHVELSGGLEITLGELGFRRLAIDRSADGQGFGLVINGVPVFCRGACWTTDDLLGLGSEGVRRTLELARAAGMNMLRVGGTTAYESDEFYALCDELGILVFQDFMFANMDYPATDPDFARSVEAEVRSLLGRIGHRPSLSILCGGSEVEQQIAMLGLPAELRESALFDQRLPALSNELAPDVPYIPSTPTGGVLPFQADHGVCHYYGVGAYMRPFDDVRRSGVRFAAECLAFANVPVRETIEHFMRDLEMPHHHPRWKERVPRDRGAGWDFEDVRDHYLRALFAVEPSVLRYADPERYLALGSAAVGEAMTATFAEWRRAASTCRGGLVFWLKDLWPGAGWGVIDSLGRPKSAYHYLARVMAPLVLLLTDEGLNGVHVHLVHDGPQEFRGQLSVALYRDGETCVAEHTRAVALAAHSNTQLSIDALVGRFCDPSHAYRFGPPAHDLIHAELRDEHGQTRHAFHFPLGFARAQERDVGLEARPESRDGQAGVRVHTRRFAQCVTLDVEGFRPADDAFHIEPGGSRWVALHRASSSAAEVRGSIRALNALSATTIAR